MEASTLQKKKNTISKGKLKKTIKNVLCRPDQLFWPELSEEEGERLESSLKKHKIEIPEFKKLLWKDLKSIPKEQRPKPPKLKKVNGLLFGMRECSEHIQKGECSAVIVESKVNPRLIVQTVVEMCSTKNIPVVCLSDLRKKSANCFGIPTSCLGIKSGNLVELRNEISELAKKYQTSENEHPDKLKKSDDNQEKMVVEEVSPNKKEPADFPTFKYLYRTNKQSRVFVPTSQDSSSKPIRKFVGQDFIEFAEKPQVNDRKTYMKMLLKRISNNPDRVKKK